MRFLELLEIMALNPKKLRKLRDYIDNSLNVYVVVTLLYLGWELMKGFIQKSGFHLYLNLLPTIPPAWDQFF